MDRGGLSIGVTGPVFCGVDGLAHEFALFAELQSELRARPNDGGGTT